MTRIAFFEPAWVPQNARDWEIRGSYKYPSLLGDLGERAEIRLLMATLPPRSDPHRQRLESEFGAAFHAIDSLEDPRWPAARILCEDYAAAIAEHAPDIVSTLNGRMIGINFALARAAREAGVDFVYRIAGNDIATQIAVQEAQARPVSGTSLWGTLAAQESFAAEAARTIVVMSATERDRIAPLVTDPDKIRLCRRGVDRAHFAPAEPAPETCRRILFVGRDSAEKGIDLIEQAAARLADSHPEMRFTIAGDFVERDEGNRRYLGFHDYAALPDLYRAHDALLLPARSEGFPQVVMEAMSCGLPAILSRHLFAADFAATGQGAALVDLEAGPIAETLAAWHDDPARYAAIRAEALDHARAHFDETTNRPLYHRALLAGDGAKPGRPRPAVSQARRYWIVTEEGLRGLSRVVDMPGWGGPSLPALAFPSDPGQRDLLAARADGLVVADTGSGLLPALLDRLAKEPARFVQLVFEPVEDFPAALGPLEERLAAAEETGLRAGLLVVGDDGVWGRADGTAPAWIETVALREALTALDPSAGVEEIGAVCAGLAVAAGDYPPIVGVIFRQTLAASARARSAAAFAEIDWREVRVRVRLDRAAALEARREAERAAQQALVGAEIDRLHRALGWVGRMRARLSRLIGSRR